MPSSKKGKRSKERNRSFNFFVEECMKTFSFLITDYGMEVLEPEICGFECSVTFRRYREFAVTILYEAGTLPWVLFTAVVKVGEEFRNEEFALDYVVEERCPDLKINDYKLGDQYEEEMRSTLLKHAEALRNCCADILEGDLSILPQVREREKIGYEKRLRE